MALKKDGSDYKSKINDVRLTVMNDAHPTIKLKLAATDDNMMNSGTRFGDFTDMD